MGHLGNPGLVRLSEGAGMKTHITELFDLTGRVMLRLYWASRIVPPNWAESTC